jgi:preprotein translocase subunit SecG
MVLMYYMLLQKGKKKKSADGATGSAGGATSSAGGATTTAGATGTRSKVYIKLLPCLYLLYLYTCCMVLMYYMLLQKGKKKAAGGATGATGTAGSSGTTAKVYIKLCPYLYLLYLYTCCMVLM